ncbi:ABC transporter ATP-binding protein [Nocardia sp. NPDC056064]|uniref:ABC transporter ATP-binding protein n=1 Tax=Nocardia sp. NPDC056064 TaxID=3345701 RepID=UPI0035D5D94F
METLDTPISAAAPASAGLLRPHLAGFTAVVLLQVLGAVAGLAPLLAVVELGRVLLSPGPIDHGHLWLVVAVGAAGLLVRLLGTAASSGIGHLLDTRVQLTFRRRLAQRLGTVPIGWFARRRTGELAKVVGDDVAAVHPFIAHAPGELVAAFVVPLVSLIYLLGIDWRLTLITLIPVALAIAFVPLMMTPARLREQAEFDTSMGRIADAVVEFVEGIAVVKAFGGTGRAHHRFRTSVDRFVLSFARMVRGLAGPAAAMQVALSPPFVLLVVLAGGAVLITGGSLAPADLLPFLLLGLGLTAPAAALGHGFDDLQAARRAVARIQQVLAVAPLPEPALPRAPHGHRASIADNIALAAPRAGRDEVVRAARLANIHDRIMELPRGYETVLGAGTGLSGGEAQRISLARALLADRPVLVLDEATSFADPQTELGVRRTLAALTGRTVLVIAHRLETIADADTVAVLDDGVIVERGRPADLLTAGGRFAAVWQAHRAAIADGSADDPRGVDLR